jgi:hypothetical protein
MSKRAETEQSINGDMSARVAVDTAAIDRRPSAHLTVMDMGSLATCSA